MTDVFVAAGSNVDPQRHLCRALQAVAEAYGPLTLSPAYRNKAVGFEGEDFINLAVGFRTQQSLLQVRQRLQEIEALCERPRDAPKWAPRTMDLDILLNGDLVSTEPGLILPRPDLVRRPYMLKPMADIAPDVRHPTLGLTMSELWRAFDASGHALVEIPLEVQLTSPRCDRHPPPESAP
jgi:2-amino-4-hydroxy-6-hydroxymethyldihydropteridine diphosphokinase